MPKYSKRKDGRYQKWVKLKDGSRKPVYGRTISELEEKAKQIECDDDKGLDVSSDYTVGEWAEQWMAVYCATLRPTTQSGYSYVYNKHIGPQIGALKLKDIRQSDVQRVMTSVASKSESLQKNVLSAAKRMFNTAIQNRHIYLNPCAGVKIVKRSDVEDTDGKLMALSNAQKDKLLAAVAGSRGELFVNIGLWCGLRREETLGQHWADINWTEQTLTVRRTVTFPDNEPIVSEKLKSKSSRRTIPIPPPLMDLLEKKNPTHASTTQIVKHHKHAPDEIILTPYICPDAWGRPMSKSAYRKFWNGVEGAVDFRVVSHMLRHTYCVWLHDNDIDLKMAQYLMGHSDIRMTANIYMQIGDDQVKNASKKILGIFNCSQNVVKSGNEQK